MNIRSFANKLSGAGVKPSLFEVQGPIGPIGQTDLTPFLVKSASLPGTQLGTIEVPYRGRRIKVPGDRTYSDWSITIINDGQFQLRNRFEDWVNRIQTTEGNISSSEVNFGSGIFCDWQVKQLDRTGSVVKAYKLIGCFPTDVSAIDLSYEATDQIEEFSVTLAYSYFTTIGGRDGNNATDGDKPDLSLESFVGPPVV